ncbi:MAG: multimeric flavodoxin WrbA [Clostridium sp.]|jgi:multimeric flavodoxin WrbA
MKYCILMGSPRKNGNTLNLIKPFIEELELN